MIDELVKARGWVWGAATGFGVLAGGLAIASVGWFIVLANSPMVAVLPMVGFFFFETAVAAVATLSLVIQGQALERLRDDPSDANAAARLLRGHQFLWGALAAGGMALIVMVCAFVPWHVSLFWR